MIATDRIRMRLCTAQQMIDLTEIFCQQLQSGKHMSHIDARCVNGLPVKPLREICVKRRRLCAGAADTVKRLAFLVLKKACVDGANQHIAVENRDHIFSETGVAHSKVGVPVALTFVIHLSDHTQADLIMPLIGLHIHAKWVCVGKKRAERFIQLLIDCNKSAEVFDAELDAVPLCQIAQVRVNFLKGAVHTRLQCFKLIRSLA